ncbi:hypothetical protein PR003_g27848 [Phytophthora rubi]|uniref:Uncharacterized protein n=2 Tax=Phytophthora TaxID=4783 RepID=A0A6A4BUY3_9STRA|nr:hypothetical protein PR002_g26584 [Phytophthora rubi]KAE9233055.1 hypothetical protein PF004_g9744 [Phytophthora fragariae]KAE9280827.1 hypothetical protein PR003_g27848 [Phytophthora rubi]
MDGELWTTAHDAFSFSVGIRGEVLLGSAVDNHEEVEDTGEASNEDDSGTKSEPTLQ